MIKQTLAISLFVMMLSLTLTGCGAPSNTTDGTSSTESAKQTFFIQSDQGGAVGTMVGDGSSIKIVFPQGALEKDAELEMGKRSETGDDILSSGFSLNQKGAKSGPVLNYPALIYIYADRDMGEDVAIVRYNDDGSYEVIPTKVSVQNGKTSLMAQVDHFSDYGARRITPEEREQAAASASEDMDFNWAIYVNDSADVDLGVMKRRITLDFKAVNTSGYVHGTYQGYARAKTTNDMEAMGGKLDADFQISDDNVSFTLEPYEKLAPLVPAEEPAELDPALAPLVPPSEDDMLAPLVPEGEGLDMSAQGTLNMKGGGTGTIQIGAYGGSRGIDATPSSDPYELYVIGPQVRLSVNITGVGTVYFDGYIRGEGK